MRKERHRLRLIRPVPDRILKKRRGIKIIIRHAAEAKHGRPALHLLFSEHLLRPGAHRAAPRLSVRRRLTGGRVGDHYRFRLKHLLIGAACDKFDPRAHREEGENRRQVRSRAVM